MLLYGSDLLLGVVDLRWCVARPILDPDEDHAVLKHRSNLDVLADEGSNLLQGISPVENLLNRHPLLAEALRGEVGVRREVDAEADPEILGLARQVVNLLEEAGLEVNLDCVIEQVRDELLRDLLLEEAVVAVIPGGLHLGEVGGAEERHLCFREDGLGGYHSSELKLVQFFPIKKRRGFFFLFYLRKT